MGKKKLTCVCRDCRTVFELEADMLVPGVEGFMNLAGGQVKILDPTRTDRMCDACCEIALAKLMASVEEAVEVEKEDAEYR